MISAVQASMNPGEGMVKDSDRLKPSQLARRAEIGRERRARTRAHLMSAAYELFARHGAEVPTIDDVVAEAGVAKGTFYNHFETRDELFRAVAQEIQESIDAVITRSFRTLRDPALRISMAFRIFARFVLSDRTRGWVWLRTMPISTANTSKATSVIRREFSAALKSGRFRAVSLDTALDLGLGLQMTTIRRLLTEKCPESYIEESAEMLLIALGLSSEDALSVSRHHIASDFLPSPKPIS